MTILLRRVLKKSNLDTLSSYLTKEYATSFKKITLFFPSSCIFLYLVIIKVCRKHLVEGSQNLGKDDARRARASIRMRTLTPSRTATASLSSRRFFIAGLIIGRWRLSEAFSRKSTVAFRFLCRAWLGHSHSIGNAGFVSGMIQGRGMRILAG